MFDVNIKIYVIEISFVSLIIIYSQILFLSSISLIRSRGYSVVKSSKHSDRNLELQKTKNDRKTTKGVLYKKVTVTVKTTEFLN